MMSDWPGIQGQNLVLGAAFDSLSAGFGYAFLLCLLSRQLQKRGTHKT